jgi:hypothetical protein
MSSSRFCLYCAPRNTVPPRVTDHLRRAAAVHFNTLAHATFSQRPWRLSHRPHCHLLTRATFLYALNNGAPHRGTIKLTDLAKGMNTLFDSGSSDELVDEIVAYAVEEFLDSEDDRVAEPGGSRPGRIKSKNRCREMVEDALFRYYFALVPAYNPTDFERRCCVKEKGFKILWRLCKQ